MTLIKTVAMPPNQECLHVEMTPDEEAQFLADQSAQQTAQNTADLKNAAKQALAASDLTCMRCIKADVSWPDEWKSYVASLRAIVDSGTGELPARPAYPEGT